MRAIVLSEELMGVALKFSRKSANVGSLLVSWDTQQQQQQQQDGDLKSKSKRFARRVQATISLCFATILLTLFVFFICALDSSSSSAPAFSSSSLPAPPQEVRRSAMANLGVVFRRGTKSMNEVVIAHVDEGSDGARGLALFLRSLHRSGVAARADIVVIFPGDARELGEKIVYREHMLFKQTLCSAKNITNPRLCGGNGQSAAAAAASNCSLSAMNVAAYERAAAEMRAKMAAKNVSASKQQQEQQELEFAWGAILGFDVGELDPTDTLAGFVDRPSIRLRRWVCYQMLLGLARRRYKAAVVAQASGVLFMSDGMLALARRSSRDGRSLVIVEEDRSWLQDGGGGAGTGNAAEGRRRHRREAPGMVEAVYGRAVWAAIGREDKAAWAVVSAAVLGGGARGVRAAAEAVTTEVARVAILRRSRRPFGDAAALNYVLRRNAGALGQKVAERVVPVGRWSAAGAAVHVLPQGLTARAAGRLDASRVFLQEGTGDPYAVVISTGGDGNWSSTNSSTPAEKLLLDDLCSSPLESLLYKRDCDNLAGSLAS